MKEINGFPGYFITPDGKVYTTRKCSGNPKGELREKAQLNDRKGYKRLKLSNSGKHKAFRVHRLVAEAFIPNPDNLPQVNHIDEDKSNNHVDNLEWVTARQNQHHSAYQQAKLYILENKNGEKFEVFNLNKWCRDNKMGRRNLENTYKGKLNWHKNHRIVSVRELSLEERRAHLQDAMITSTTE